MFFGFDLKEIFMFPIKDAEARKHFMVGTLVSLSAFIIPLIPFFILYGYAIRIVKQILNRESPRMVAWDDWGGMFKDGAKLFGIRIIYSIPILVISMPLFLIGMAMPFLAENMNSANTDAFIALFTVLMTGSICIIIPLSIPLVVIIPAAEMYAVDKNEFAAGFRFREWWQILRANLGGFIAAFGIYYLASIALALAIQIIGVTFILACLLIILMPATILYLTLIMYTTIALAYKSGKEKLSQQTD